jgi:hypothetical protein
VPFEGNGWKPDVITRFVAGYATALCPVRVDTNHGEGFLKALGNPEGPDSLARELIGSLAAEWLGLPTLDFSLIVVTEDDELPMTNGVRALPGAAFISRAEKNVFTWGGDLPTLRRVSNSDVISALIVLDTWISNCDRYAPDGSRANLSNVFLIEYSEKDRGLELRAMDFTHAFTWGEPLDHRLGYAEKIQDQRIYGCFPAFRSLLRREVVLAFLQRLGSFSKGDAEVFMFRLPVEWRISPAVKIVWSRFLVDRARFVARTLEHQLWPQMLLAKGASL